MKHSMQRLLTAFQAKKFYRNLARRLIGRKAHCRVATAEDAPHLKKFFHWADSAEIIAGELADSPNHRFILVAELNHRIVAGAILRQFEQEMPSYPAWWLFDMIVLAPYRGAGIGEKLTRLALDTAAGSGAARVHLLSFDGDQAANALYRKMGFRPGCLPALESELEQQAAQGERRRIVLSLTLDNHTHPNHPFD